MGISAGPSGVSDGLVFQLDAANLRSYSGSGNTANGLVSGIGGTLVNGVGFSSINGGSFIFDGTNDYIELGTSIQNYSVFTTSFWINFNFFDASHRSPLGDDSGQFSYHILFWSGSIYLGFPASYIGITHNNISINTWYNFVVTKNSSHSVSFYQNSLLLGTDFVEAGKLVSINKIGRGYVYDNAKISNVSFYNRPLSATEIQQNFNAMRERYNI
jgi:hypothetical protein